MAKPQVTNFNFGQKGLMPFLAAVLFALIFAAFSAKLIPDTAGITNQQILNVFEKWSVFAGVIFGLLSMLLMYIVRLLGVCKLRVAGPLLLLIGFAPWLAFGYQLVYVEPRYAAIAIAIIEFLGGPLFYAGATMMALGLIWILAGKALKMLILSAVVLPLTGCLGDLIEFSCIFVDDPDHCYQSAAVQSAEPDECANIKGEEFSGSNPPRDKCYLMIAQNTGDYSACDKIQGGAFSYTREECILGATISNNDPAGCAKLTGSDREECKSQLGANITTQTLSHIADEIEDAKSALGRDPDNPELKAKLAELEAKKKDLYSVAPASVQTDYFRESREAIMEGLDDDVKSVIAKQFTAYRADHPDEDQDQLLKKMEGIKEDQEYIKRLDDQVNEVFDSMKNNVIDFVETNVDEATGASKFAEEMQERGLEWFKENGGDRVKAGIANLEWAKKKYDKASEQYKQISVQIEKLQKAYNEATEVYKKIDDINKLVAEGKLDKGKASVLHGAILLGKGLEYATDYVPVFGSTISTISKETFEATIKFATKRAERTTSLDKCIEDPENCDPNNISPY